MPYVFLIPKQDAAGSNPVTHSSGGSTAWPVWSLMYALIPGRMSRAFPPLSRPKPEELALPLARHPRIGGVTTRELRGRLTQQVRRWPARVRAAPRSA